VKFEKVIASKNARFEYLNSLEIVSDISNLRCDTYLA